MRARSAVRSVARDEIVAAFERAWHESEAAAVRRAHRESRRGHRTARCGVCGRFKPRPSATCDYCGDEPMPLGSDPHVFDREWAT